MSYADARLPPELRERLRLVFRLPLPADATLAAVAPLMGGGLRIADLLAAGPTRHEVRVGDRLFYTNCFIDALMLPHVLDVDAVEIRSWEPQGGEVRVRATRAGAESAAEDVVVSFGMSHASGGAVQVVACPYINAFASRAGYERWAAATSEAVTVGLSLGGAVEFARALATGLDGRPGPASCC